MAQTVVESFHINVGLGDSAIHVLATWNRVTNEVVARQAVLVDGGLARDAAAQNIAQTIDEIENRYSNLRKQGQVLRFRSVVVTHWDADHWGGINQLLKRELGTHFDKKTSKYNRFYHKDDTLGVKPTIVYAPTTQAGKKKKGRKGKGKQKESEVSGIAIVKGKNETYEFSFNGEFQAKAMVGSSIIGYNFFTNTKPSGLGHDKLGSFKALMGGNTAHPEVGMYCVASDLAVIGHEKRPRWTVELTDTLHNQMPTKTNQQSIAAIILWNNKHVSHYFAGDLDFRGEALLARWLGNNLEGNGTGNNIHFLKSSHHGARNSNPPVLFATTKPKYVIFSVADHYGHPAWETLLMLFEFYRVQNRIDKPAQGPCILTCYPYWLANIHGHDGLESNSANYDPYVPGERFEKLSPTRQKHANHLKKLFKHLSAGFSDESLDEYIRQGCISDGATTDDEIFEQVAIAFVARASSLFYNLWEWGQTTGRTLNELVYTRLTLTNNIAEEQIFFQTKDLPYDRTAQIDTVYLKKPNYDDGAHSFKSLPPIVDNKIVQHPTDQTALVLVDQAHSISMSKKRRSARILNKRIQKRVRDTKLRPDRDLGSDDEDSNSAFPALFSMAHQKLQGPLSDASVSARASGASLPGRYAYSILSSSHAPSVSSRTDSLGYAVLGVNDWLDDFLLSMRPSTMRLASSIKNEWALLHDEDYLGTWIQGSLGGSQMAVNRQGPAFRIITPHWLVSSTKAAPKALGTDAMISNDGLSPWTAQGTMVFAESQPKASSWSIGEILSLFPNDPSANVDPLSRTAAIVNDNLLGLKWTLNLEASAGKRNAIWLTPIASYLTVLRLVFVPENESKDALRRFLGLFFSAGVDDDEPVLDVSNVQLILRKTSTVKAREGEGTKLASGQTLTLSAVVKLLGPKPDDLATPRAQVSPTISVELASTGALELTIKTTRSSRWPSSAITKSI
ncbi:hypothetical protein QQX98_007945 [Neonectria punicea]|uniref:Metallo-beta-lactamase domain-containing protein n=1 Tax=Neonectria punicea TaxID=979145 RepID=A0ABR1GWI7_9HYPO